MATPPKAHSIRVTRHPSSAKVKRWIYEAYPFGEGAPKYMIFDNDKIFGKEVDSALKNLHIKGCRTLPKSPWMNGVAERWIGSVRREMLNHVII